MLSLRQCVWDLSTLHKWAFSLSVIRILLHFLGHFSVVTILRRGMSSSHPHLLPLFQAVIPHHCRQSPLTIHPILITSTSVVDGHHSVFSAPATPAVFSPTLPFQHDDIRRDDLSSSSSEDSDKDDFERDRQQSYRRPVQTSQRKSSGFSAVSPSLSERWPGTPANRSFSGPTTERNIDFELDVRVEIDSGKCVLHPTTQQPEHEDVSLRRNCERSLRNLDQESPPKKRKLQPNYPSSSHLLAGKKCPSTLPTKSNDSFLHSRSGR
uniref:Bridge-like lipid transfer protein family member 1 C-terminal domain-containing protein n=1 Tax=Neolamprologus brichardi TaxID=32507 RepID=A0A3Q4ID22_NEOBR